MTRIPTRIRIFIALFLSILVVRLLPSLLVTSPYIPTREELLHLVTLPSIKLMTWNVKTSVEEKKITPILAELALPSPIPTIADMWSGPTVIPQHVTSFPTPELSLFPTSEIIPTVRPTRQPTAYPTSPPPPTPIPVKTPDYSKLNGFVSNPPQIGCRNNTISGCPYETLYQTPVDKGLGWATYYGDEHSSGYNVVADVIHNNKGITIDAARKFISDNYMEKQSNMTPDEAKKTGKVIAYAATRTPKDLWKIKYMFGIDDAKNPKARFIGRVMIIDCAAPNDWKGNLSILSYGYKGWSAINWIIDLSKNGFIQLPTGLSGVQGNTGEGRPGVILIDEGSLDGLIY